MRNRRRNGVVGPLLKQTSDELGFEFRVGVFGTWCTVIFSSSWCTGCVLSHFSMGRGRTLAALGPVAAAALQSVSAESQADDFRIFTARLSVRPCYSD